MLYSETLVVHYHRFFRLITFGLLIYAVTGPIIGMIAPAFIHAIHGTAALFITLGLYDLIRGDIQPDDDFAAILSADSANLRPEVDTPDQ